MWDLSKHERLETEILKGLNSTKVLEHLIFCGGTMLRLCHELNRYSVDLDFWLSDKSKKEKVFNDIKLFLEGHYRVKMALSESGILLFEFVSKGYPRALKIEIRLDKDSVRYEEKIAFSKHSPIQVLVKAATLDEMMRAKIETFLSRSQIRDAFDIEFLLRRGVELRATKDELKEIERLIRKFKTNDYKIKLGSLLEFKDRQYYKTAKFSHILGHIKATSIQ